jgi:predicted nucleic acid-binding protein
LGNRIGEDRAMEALADYIDLPLARHGHLALLGRMLALRSTFSACDASYVALAEGLDAVLLTADRRIGDSLRAMGSSLEIRP